MRGEENAAVLGAKLNLLRLDAPIFFLVRDATMRNLKDLTLLQPPRGRNCPISSHKDSLLRPPQQPQRERRQQPSHRPSIDSSLRLSQMFYRRISSLLLSSSCWQSTILSPCNCTLPFPRHHLFPARGYV